MSHNSGLARIVDEPQFLPSVVASMDKHPKIVSRIISHGSGLARIVDEPQFLPSVVASMDKHPKIVSQIISHDSGLARIVDEPQFLPTIVAMSRFNEEVTAATISHNCGLSRVEPSMLLFRASCKALASDDAFMSVLRSPAKYAAFADAFAAGEAYEHKHEKNAYQQRTSTKRRQADQIQREYWCQGSGCDKGYGTKKALNLHLKNYPAHDI
jgi:hypothetical protein